MNDDQRIRPKEGAGQRLAEPLPREWLPEASPPSDDPIWETRVLRIMARSAPELSRLSNRKPVAVPTLAGLPWWAELERWWKPATALAVAASALLFAVDRPAPPASASADAITLGLMAADGDPVAIWEALGTRAHPVLALLALEDHSGMSHGDRVLPTAPAGPR